MKFYEILRLLMEEPGKHHFRRKSWENNYSHRNTKFIGSIAITATYTQLITVHKDNSTGYTYYPDINDITASDWMEV